jgi:hypothetical protein
MGSEYVVMDSVKENFDEEFYAETVPDDVESFGSNDAKFCFFFLGSYGYLSLCCVGRGMPEQSQTNQTGRLWVGQINAAGDSKGGLLIMILRKQILGYAPFGGIEFAQFHKI